MNKLAIDNGISDLIADKIKSLKNEIKELKIELDDLNKMNAAFDETNLDLSFIETMLNKCSIIDSLDHEEIQELIDVLIDKITWNGDSHEVTINFTGSNSEKD